VSILARSTTTHAAVAFLAASGAACSSSVAEPTESSAQADTLGGLPPIPDPGSGGVLGDFRLQCVDAMLSSSAGDDGTSPVPADDGTSPVPAGPPPAGMEACTSGQWLDVPGSFGINFWVCPDSLEGSLPPGIGVGGDVWAFCAPDSFFAYQWVPCTSRGGACDPTPGGGCTGGCRTITGTGP
jgi:hypothetical protein